MPISALGYAGLAKESVWGTPVAANKWMPVKDHKFEEDIKTILDEGKRGIAAKDFGLYQGTKLATLEQGGDFYPDVPPNFLLGIMGSVATTGVGPYTHTFSLGATQPSLTVHDYDGLTERQFAGCLVDEFSMKFATDEGALSWSAKMKGKSPTSIAKSTPTFGTLNPILGWQASLNLNSIANTNLLGFELTCKRETKPVFGANNSQAPSKIHPGVLEVTGKISFDMAATTEYDLFGNNTQPPLALTLTSGANILVITMTKCAFEKANVDQGKEFVQVDASIRGIWNTTDSGPVKFAVTNSVVSY